MAESLVWFFGYGSLMWRPGFAHDAFEPARLDGYHRALCIRSTHYRGTAAAPGVVLGLAPGGACVGRAIGVAPARAPEVLAYLDARELIGAYVYDRRELPLRLLACATEVHGWAYLAKPDHEDFIDQHDGALIRRLVRQGHGSAGACSDYLRNTVAHLQEMGIAEPHLEALVAELHGSEG